MVIRRIAQRLVAIGTLGLVSAFALMLAPWIGQPATPAQAQLQLGGCRSGFQLGQLGGIQLGAFQLGQGGLQLGGTTCSFGGGAINLGLNIGAFQLLAPSSTVSVGEHLPLVFFWEVPIPSVWQDLQTLDVRLKDASGNVAFWIAWDQASDSLGIVDPATERVVTLGHPGQATTLDTNLFSLSLGESASQNSGPGGQLVAVLFTISPKTPAAGQTFSVEVRGRNDAGVVQGFSTVGSLEVRGPGKDDKDRKRLSDEQRDQLRRGNALGSDSLRAEGNVIAPPHCLSVVSAGIDGVPAWLTQQPGPWIIFADRDGLKRGDLRDEAALACESIRMGNYIAGTGVEESDREFEFQSISIER